VSPGPVAKDGFIPAAKKTAGLYIHVPFCLSKCPYCDFYSVTDLKRKDAYLASVLLEMEKVSTKWADTAFDTLYFGGGTPSLLSPFEVEKLLKTAENRFRFRKDVEVTLEANPGTVDRVRLEGYKTAGVNRIVIGVQSFSLKNLAFLGRIHTDTEAERAVEAARRAGFDNIGIDLIFGLPGQSKGEWLADLKKAVRMDPAHLSCYLLSYAPGTMFFARRTSGIITALPQKRRATLFLTASEFLEKHGYTHYEVSNYARNLSGCSDALRSRHNQKYWNFSPYAGLGPGAHSFRKNQRWWNLKNIDAYVDQIASGNHPVGGGERLSAGQQQMEVVYLGLRRREGIDVGDFDRRFGVSLYGCLSKTAARLRQEGWAILTPDHFYLTRRGMLHLDDIAAVLVSHLSWG